MTPEEKLAAQWEARHDAAARHRGAAPAGVPEYLGHLHAQESLRSHPAGSPPRPARAGTEDPGPAPTRRQPSWLRRLFARRTGG
jgi:hypothetical protein